MNEEKDHAFLIPRIYMTDEEIIEEGKKRIQKFKTMNLCESCDRWRKYFNELDWPSNGSNIICLNLKCENVYKLFG